MKGDRYVDGYAGGDEEAEANISDSEKGSSDGEKKSSDSKMEVVVMEREVAMNIRKRRDSGS